MSELANLQAEYKRREEEEALRQRALMSNASPDAVAKALQQGRQAGLPDQQAVAYPEQAKIAYETETLRGASPKLREWLAEGHNLDVARDDVPTLSRLETSFREFFTAAAKGAVNVADFVTGDPRQTGAPAAARIPQVGVGRFSEGVYGAAAAPLESVDAVANSLARWSGYESIQELQKAVGIGDEQGRTLIDFVISSLREAAATTRSANQFYSPTEDTDSLIAKGLVAGAESFVAMLPGLLTGGAGGATAVGALTTGGSAYTQARDEGLDVGRSLLFAAGQGATEAATELAPTSYLFKFIKGGSPLVTSFVKQLLTDVLGEQAATLLQDANEWVTLHPEKTVQQFIDERPSAAIQTFWASVMGTTLNTALGATLNSSGLARTTRAQSAAKETLTRFDALQRVAKASALLARDKETFKDFVTSLVGENEDGNVYVDKERLDQALNQDAELAATVKASPALMQAIAASQQTGLVALPVAEVVATPALAKLREDIRLTPGGFSAREAADELALFAKRAEEDYRGLEARYSKDAPQRTAFEKLQADTAKRLADAGIDLMFGAGYVNNVSKAWANMAAVFADRMDMPLTDLLKKYPAFSDMQFLGLDSAAPASSESARRLVDQISSSIESVQSALQNANPEALRAQLAATQDPVERAAIQTALGERPDVSGLTSEQQDAVAARADELRPVAFDTVLDEGLAALEATLRPSELDQPIGTRAKSFKLLTARRQLLEEAKLFVRNHPDADNETLAQFGWVRRPVAPGSTETNWVWQIDPAGFQAKLKADQLPATPVRATLEKVVSWDELFLLYPQLKRAHVIVQRGSNIPNTWFYWGTNYPGSKGKAGARKMRGNTVPLAIISLPDDATDQQLEMELRIALHQAVAAYEGWSIAPPQEDVDVTHPQWAAEFKRQKAYYRELLEKTQGRFLAAEDIVLVAEDLARQEIANRYGVEVPLDDFNVATREFESLVAAETKKLSVLWDKTSEDTIAQLARERARLIIRSKQLSAAYAAASVRADMAQPSSQPALPPGLPRDPDIWVSAKTNDARSSALGAPAHLPENDIQYIELLAAERAAHARAQELPTPEAVRLARALTRFRAALDTLAAERKPELLQILASRGLVELVKNTEYNVRRSHNELMSRLAETSDAVARLFGAIGRGIDYAARIVVGDELDQTLADEIDVEGVMRSTTNAEGRPIANTLDGVRAFWRWFGDSKMVDPAGRPLVLYHGTTADFDSFSRAKLNPESDMGAAFYFSDTIEDSNTNYAREGPDLRNKIARIAEPLADEIQDVYDALVEEEGEEAAVAAIKARFGEDVYDENTLRMAENIARRRLDVQHFGAILPAYLKADNPVILGGPDETVLTFEQPYDEETDEFGEPEGTLIAFAEALRRIANESQYLDTDGDAAFGALIEAAADYGQLTASEIKKLLQEEGNGLVYAQDGDTGDLVSSDIIRRAFEAVGFDGFIDRTVSEKFKNMTGMAPHTQHFGVFAPTQIKSAVGNRGTFSPTSANVLEQARGRPPASYSYARALREIRKIPAREAAPLSDAELLAAVADTPAGLGDLELEALKYARSGLAIADIATQLSLDFDREITPRQVRSTLGKVARKNYDTGRVPRQFGSELVDILERAASGNSIREIADATGKNANNIRQQLLRVRKAFPQFSSQPLYQPTAPPELAAIGVANLSPGATDWFEDQSVLAAVRDPATGALYAGEDHLSAIDAAPAEAFDRLSTAYENENRGSPDVGMILRTPDGIRYLPRAQAMAEITRQVLARRQRAPLSAYPLAPRNSWYGEANYEADGGRLVAMSPDAFLASVRPLEIDAVSRDTIDDLKRHMVVGNTLEPLVIYADGREDGRHRAIAARELGLTSVPVIRFDAPRPDERVWAAEEVLFQDEFDQVQTRFYSALEKELRDNPKAPKVADAKQWQGFLENTPGIKRTELDWVAMTTWLSTRGSAKITREEVQEWVSARGFQIAIMEFSDRAAGDSDRWSPERDRAYQRFASDYSDEIYDRAYDLWSEQGGWPYVSSVWEMAELGVLTVPADDPLREEYGLRVNENATDDEPYGYVVDGTTYSGFATKEEALRDYELEYQMASDSFIQDVIREIEGDLWAEHKHEYQPRGTKYDTPDLTNPGGTDARELVLHYKHVRSRERTFSDDHFPTGDRDVLGWIRVKTRRLADGRKVLAVEEFQPQRQQRAREGGILDSEELARAQERAMEARLAKEDAEKKYQRSVLAHVVDAVRRGGNPPSIVALFENNTTFGTRWIYDRLFNWDPAEGGSVQLQLRDVLPFVEGQSAPAPYDTPVSIVAAPNPALVELKRKLGAAEREADAAFIARYALEKAVPDFPHKDTDSVVALMLRTVVDLAAQEGLSGVAWTVGDDQNARYNLSRVVSRITVLRTLASSDDGLAHVQLDFKNGDSGTVFVNAEGVVTQTTSRVLRAAVSQPLTALVGKELAATLLSAPAGQAIEGAGLEVGGKGMREFYDRIVPKVAKNIFRAHKVSTSIATIDSNDWHFMEIPDSLRAQAMQEEAFPLFQDEFDAVQDYFYSALAREIRDNPKAPKAAPAEQWKGFLKNTPGIKKAELDWVGIDEWLDLQSGKITREQVSEFVESRGFTVSLMEFSDRVNDDEAARERFLEKYGDAISDAASDAWAEHGWPYVDSLDDMIDSRILMVPEDDERAIEQGGELRSTSDGTFGWSIKYPYSERDVGFDTEEEAFKAYSRSYEDARDSAYTDDYASIEERFWANYRDEFVGDREAQYSSWTDRGGTQYREYVVHYKGVAKDQTATFSDQHFSTDDRDVLGWIRVKTRTLKDGRRVLDVEEFQPQRQQKAREQGLASKAAIESAKAELDAAQAARAAARAELDIHIDDALGRAIEAFRGINRAEDIAQLTDTVRLPNDTRSMKDVLRARFRRLYMGNLPGVVYFGLLRSERSSLRPSSLVQLTEDEAQQWRDNGAYVLQLDVPPRQEAAEFLAADESTDLREREAIGKWRALRDGIPDFPHKDTDTVTALMLRMVVRMAAQRNMAGITWTLGAQQNARYSLSTVVESINVIPQNNQEGWRRIELLSNRGSDLSLLVDAEGVVLAVGPSSLEDARGKPLADVVGEALAAKILAVETETTFEGDDLELGGEGMREFYDRIVPKVAKNIFKAHKVTTSRVEMDVPGGLERHFMEIPDSLREQARQAEAFPLMQSRTSRGSILIPSQAQREKAQPTIRLGRTANFSTFLHEMGHFQLDMLMQLAAEPDATDSIKADAQAVLRWFATSRPAQVGDTLATSMDQSLRDAARRTDDERSAWFDENVTLTRTGAGFELRFRNEPELEVTAYYDPFHTDGRLVVDFAFQGGYERDYTRVSREEALGVATRVLSQALPAIQELIVRVDPPVVAFAGATFAHAKLYGSLLKLWRSTRFRVFGSEQTTFDRVGNPLEGPWAAKDFMIVREDVSDPQDETGYDEYGNRVVLRFFPLLAGASSAAGRDDAGRSGDAGGLRDGGSLAQTVSDRRAVDAAALQAELDALSQPWQRVLYLAARGASYDHIARLLDGQVKRSSLSAMVSQRRKRLRDAPDDDAGLDAQTLAWARGTATVEAATRLLFADDTPPLPPAERPPAPTTPQEWLALDINAQRDYHEMWARGFEAYLLEDRAPNPEMRSVFAAFAALLKRVYVDIASGKSAASDPRGEGEMTGQRRSFGGLDVQLSDEVRAVMDRLVATDAQIDLAERSSAAFRQLFPSQPPWMTDAEWAEYERLAKASRDNAVRDLEKTAVKDLQWLSRLQQRLTGKQKRAVAKLRKEIEAQARADLEQQPIYRAIAFLRRGDGTGNNHKLDAAAVVADYKIELPKTYATQTGQWHPDVLADLLGFESGEALVVELLNAPPLAEALEAETDRRMLEEHGDLGTPEGLQRAVAEAMHNNVRLRLVAHELNALNKLIGKPRELIDAVKVYARKLVDALPLRDLRAEAYIESADAAARRADATLRSQKSGDATKRLEEAARYKRAQLVNMRTAREVLKAQKERTRIENMFARVLAGKEDDVAKRRDYNLVMVARSLLGLYGFGTRTQQAKAFEYMRMLQEYDPDAFSDISQVVEAAVLAAPQTPDKSKITFAQLKNLHEVVDMLWARSRAEKVAVIAGERVERSELVDELVAQLDTLKTKGSSAGRARGVTATDRLSRSLLGIRAGLRRVEQWTRKLDLGAIVGPWTKFVFQPMSDAAVAYRADANVRLAQLLDILKPLSKDLLRARKIEAKELGYTFNDKGALLHVLLHLGNPSNKRKLLLGYGWGSIDADTGELVSPRFDAFLDRMHREGVIRKEHWDAVQKIWDLMEDMKPATQEAHRAVYGRYFGEISAEAVRTPFGTYAGGYVPALPEGFVVLEDAQRRAADALLDATYQTAFPTPQAGFTKARVETYAKPLALDLSSLVSHVDSVLKFTHLGPPARQTARLLRDARLQEALNAYDPTAINDILLPWLQRSTKQITEVPMTSTGGRAMAAFLSTVRRRSSMALMFANVVNTAQQITGLVVATTRVSPLRLLWSSAQYLANPWAFANRVTTLSPWMKQRMHQQVYEMTTEIRRITALPNAAQYTAQWFERHTYFMQQAFQNVIDLWVWQAAYRSALDQDVEEAFAIRYADGVVRQTMGTTNPEDVSAAEVTNAVGKIFTHMTGYFNAQMNSLGTEASVVFEKHGFAGTPKLAWIYFAGLAVPAIAANALALAMRGQWDATDEEEEDPWLWWWNRFLLPQIKFLLAGLPVAGPLVNTALNAFNNLPYDDRMSAPALSVAERVVQTPATIPKDLEDGELSRRGINDVGSLVTLFAGVPATGVTRSLGYQAAVDQGDVTPVDDWDQVRGLITGAPSEASKN